MPPGRYRPWVTLAQRLAGVFNEAQLKSGRKGKFIRIKGILDTNPDDFYKYSGLYDVNKKTLNIRNIEPFLYSPRISAGRLARLAGRGIRNADAPEVLEVMAELNRKRSFHPKITRDILKSASKIFPEAEKVVIHPKALGVDKTKVLRITRRIRERELIPTTATEHLDLSRYRK